MTEPMRSMQPPLDRRFRERLLDALQRKVGPRPSCEDAVQDALVYITEHPDKFAQLPKARRFSRALRLACWAYCNVYRCATRREQREFGASVLAEVEAPPPDSILGSAEASRGLGRLIRSLPADVHAVIVACDLEGLSDSEVAVKLGIPRGTVKTRRRDGHVLLRRLCSREGLV